MPGDLDRYLLPDGTLDAWLHRPETLAMIPRGAEIVTRVLRDAQQWHAQIGSPMPYALLTLEEADALFAYTCHTFPMFNMGEYRWKRWEWSAAEREHPGLKVHGGKFAGIQLEVRSETAGCSSVG